MPYQYVRLNFTNLLVPCVCMHRMRLELSLLRAPHLLQEEDQKKPCHCFHRGWMMMARMLQAACHYHHPPFQSHQGKSRHPYRRNVWEHYHFQCHDPSGLPRTKEIERTWSGKNRRACAYCTCLVTSACQPAWLGQKDVPPVWHLAQ